MTNGSGRTLVLLRHAKSDWSGPEADIERPLAERGVRQAGQAGLWLAEHAAAIGLAVISPANRARQTWELASVRLSTPPQVLVDDRVYAATAGQLLAVLREIPDDVETLVLVGHNPGMEDLASALAGELVTLRTSGIAVFRMLGSWNDLSPATAELLKTGRASGDKLS
ncbi:SixA phosphatase family protein [Leifsonia poae]|uniref:SixA phosphatase family protein n=1 Tax=Leifsonia poae TaxID=110933 RepID=UPI003D67263D